MKLINISLLSLFLIHSYQGNGFILKKNDIDFKKEEKYTPNKSTSFSLKTRSIVDEFVSSNDISEQNIKRTVNKLIGKDWKNINKNDINSDLEKRKDILLDYGHDHGGKFCEVSSGDPLEGYDGYKLSCSGEDVIFVDYVFWGRHSGDNSTCREKDFSDKEENYLVLDDENCGYSPIQKIKDLCDGKKYCHLKPNTRILKDPCRGRVKYLEVKHSCIKKPYYDPKFAVVMFIDSQKTKPNTIYDYALQDFKEYTRIHNYTLFVNEKLYDSEREIYYMKQYTIIECLTESLRNGDQDWILWVDGDVVLMNKSLELKAFLPPDDDDDKDEINLLIAKDRNGINAGVFLLKVNPWSLSFMLRAASYSYYNPKTFLKYSDQTAMWKVMTEYNEKSHYIIVPQFWFNSYFNDDFNKIKGNFLTHFPGNKNRADTNSRILRKQIEKDKGEGWYINTRTTEDMAKLAYDFYHSKKVN